MSPLPRDLLPLWRPAVALLVALVIGWTVVSYANAGLARSRDNVATHQKTLQEARQRFQRSDEEKATILKYLPDYQALQHHGFIGSENRLEWIDALRAADREAGLDGVQFQIAPQQKFEHAAAHAAIVPRMRRSIMRLTLGLTHEVDLLEFLDALHTSSRGVFVVRACVLNAQTSEPAPRRANLQAECELDWFSVASKEPEA